MSAARAQHPAVRASVVAENSERWSDRTGSSATSAGARARLRAGAMSSAALDGWRGGGGGAQSWGYATGDQKLVH